MGKTKVVLVVMGIIAIGVVCTLLFRESCY